MSEMENPSPWMQVGDIVRHGSLHGHIVFEEAEVKRGPVYYPGKGWGYLIKNHPGEYNCEYAIFLRHYTPPTDADRIAAAVAVLSPWRDNGREYILNSVAMKALAILEGRDQ